MIFGYLTLFTALAISLSAAVYSILGLTAIFAAAFWPIVILGGSLEFGKIVTTLWLHKYWDRAEIQYKVYLCSAVAILMLLTSMGVFGFLSKAHLDQAVPTGDVAAKVAIYDEKIRTERDNIEAARKSLQQMDSQVDARLSRGDSEQSAERAVQIRRGQARERAKLQKEISDAQTTISKLNEERAPIASELRKVEAEVGPIKYIAALVYGDNPDANLLEKAVRWVIILIVVVFDPLALTLLLAATKTFEWERKINIFAPRRQEETVKDSTFTAPVDDLVPVFDREEIPDHTDYSDGLEVVAEPAPAAEEKKTSWAGFGFPMSSVFGKPKKQTINFETQEPETAKSTTVETLPNPMAMDERPGDYVEPTPPANYIREAVPGVNRGVSQTVEVPAVGVRRKAQTPDLAVSADNAPALGKASSSGFGSEYPKNPEKGDIYLRTDSLPNRLFKFNGSKWIEVDKNSTDVYAYEEAYIRHLITEIDAGRYDADTLTDVEREQIAEYLRKHAQ